MQYSINEAIKPKNLRESAISIPNKFYMTNQINKDLEVDTCYYPCGSENALLDLWNKQHPLIHSWLVISSISICFLFALFFIF